MPLFQKFFPSSSSSPPPFHSFSASSANAAANSLSDRRLWCPHCKLTLRRSLTRQKKLRRITPGPINAPPDSPAISPSFADSPVRSDLKALDLAEPSGKISSVSTPGRSPSRSPKIGKKLGFPSRPESSAHPLPLPPEPTLSYLAVPLPPPISHHKQECPNVSLWQKGKFIGRGTFCSVYVGINRETGALCAIKEVYISPDDPKSAECIKQMEQEIRLLQYLEHPNIVQYYGSEIVDDHFYIYMEYVYPGSIRKYVNEYSGVLTESIIRNFTRHILSGLAYLHSKKTILRDIKGANLLVDSSGVVKLADFGMAKHLSGLSFKMSLKGTPHWMAPEVIKAVIQKDGNPDLALAVDIWSLGCTIIEMFSGKSPWGDIEGPQAMFKVLTGSPPIPESLSPVAKDFLQCCFQRNPVERPSATMLLDHAFVKSSSEHNLSICRQDKSQTSRECAAKNNDLMPDSPNTRVMKEKLHCNRYLAKSTIGVCRH